MEYYFNHCDISDNEKKLIKKPEDYLIFSLIDALSSDEISAIDKSILPNSLKQYNSLQKEWISTFEYFWGKNHNKDPQLNINSCIEDFFGSLHPRRYRLWYAVSFPEEISLENDNNESLELTKAFLSEAKKELCDYYTTIFGDSN